jgi:hypothetical protein
MGLSIGVAAGASVLADAAGAASHRTGHVRAQHRSGTAALHETVHNPRGHFLGVLPSTLHHGTLAAGKANGAPPLTYHGGPVQHSSKAYVIFWVPSGYYYPANVKAEVAQYFTDVAAASWKTSNVYGALTQYCQGVPLERARVRAQATTSSPTTSHTVAQPLSPRPFQPVAARTTHSGAVRRRRSA